MRKFILICIILLMTGCNKKVYVNSDEEMQQYITQGSIYYEQKEYEKGDAVLEKALKMGEKIYGDNSSSIADIYIMLGTYARTYESAEAYAKKAESIYLQLNDMGGLAKLFYLYGGIRSNLNDKVAAEKYYEEALEYCADSEDGSYPLRCQIYLKMGVNSDSYIDSVNYYKLAEEQLDYLDAEAKANVQETIYSNIGNCYYSLDEDVLAIEYYEKAIQIMEDEESSNDALLGEVYDNCGYCYAGIGEYIKAVEYIEKAIDIKDNCQESTIWERAVAYRHLSVVYTADELNDYEKVLEYGVESCRIYELQQDLDSDDLNRLLMLKEAFKLLYMETPQSQEQDFEEWYLENIYAE